MYLYKVNQFLIDFVVENITLNKFKFYQTVVLIAANLCWVGMIIKL